MALECSTPSLATRANGQHVGAIRLVLLPNGLLYGSHLHLLHKNRSAPLTLATIIHHDINSLLSSSHLQAKYTIESHFLASNINISGRAGINTAQSAQGRPQPFLVVTGS